MSPEAQKIAIAKACGRDVIGWRFFWRKHDETTWRNSPTYTSKEDAREWADKEARWSSEVKPVEDFEAPDMCPNYPDDLNAMFEAEKILTMDKEYTYGMKLAAMILEDFNEEVEGFTPNGFGYYAIAHAPAARRAEAFLRTMNLWTES